MPTWDRVIPTWDGGDAHMGWEMPTWNGEKPTWDRVMPTWDREMPSHTNSLYITGSPLWT